MNKTIHKRHVAIGYVLPSILTKIASLLKCVNRLAMSSLFGVILVFCNKTPPQKSIKKQQENMIIPSVRPRICKLKYAMLRIAMLQIMPVDEFVAIWRM